jgi:hypothetical protein
MSKETISEEFARELLEDTYGDFWHPDKLLKHWKRKGYIKQSREEEIREELKRLQDDISYRIDQGSNYQNKLYYELVEILDKRLEEK